MSKKTDVLDLYEAGKTRDQIHEETGITKRYIRAIVNEFEKGDSNRDVPGEGQEQEGEEIGNEGMDFNNDLEGENNQGGGNMGDPKTGKEFHKAWVNAKAFECACGCTLNRKSKFCPNCGITLDWSGF